MVEVFEGQPFELHSSEDGHTLQRLLRGFVSRSGNAWTISRVVGHLRLDAKRILHIRSPKATAASLLSWMAFVDPRMHALGQLCQTPKSGSPGDLTGALAWLFCEQLQLIARRNGLLKRYQHQIQVLGTVRGRIEFAQMARKVTTADKIPCQVTERVHQTKLNQLLAAAFEIIKCDPWLRQRAGPAYGPCLELLQSVSAAVDRPLLSGRVGLNRLESPFEPVLTLARLLLQGNALGDLGGREGLGFLVNLETLFERTVTRAIHEAGLPYLEQAPLSYAREDCQHWSSFSVDVMILTSPPVVVDAKFKSAVSSANLQQMVTYCLMTGARRAVLVLPAGHLKDRRSYRFPIDPIWGGGEVRVDLVELKTDGQCLAAWRTNAQALVAEILTQGSANPGNRPGGQNASP